MTNSISLSDSPVSLSPATTERVAGRIPLDAIEREQARRHHLRFMQTTWARPSPMIVGQHTRAICARIDRAITDYRAGRSTYLIVMVPFRHGKSEIVSRYLPVHFLGLFPDEEVLVATYAQDLVDGFSRFGRALIRSERYCELFPDIEISDESSAVHHWELRDRLGSFSGSGLGGTMTGRGYALGIVDDYHKDRQDAESPAIRESNWTAFTESFLTRGAPVSITLIAASPWGVDDIIGRIRKAMRDDPAFPCFEILRWPAASDDYEGGYLFLDRFSPEWYRQQFAALGSYAAAGLLQCEPVARVGNLLKTDRIEILDALPEGLQLRWVRAWDLASTEKQVAKSDPDWTAGMQMAVEYRREPGLPEPLPHLWIRDVMRGRWAAPERDRRIEQTAMSDGPEVRVGTESVAGYKDTYARLAEILRGRRVVEKVTPPGDLLIRVAPLEPIFEAGHVHLLRGDWNQPFISEATEYPRGAHDDQVAAMVTGYEMIARVVEWGVLHV